MGMTLEYIWHDGFFLETDDATIVFDFWKDPTVRPNELPRFIEWADKDKPLYVVVSHHHKDHYTKRIFAWHSLFKKIRYILSADTAKAARHILTPNSIYAGPKPPEDIVTVLSPGGVFDDGTVRIEAFPSTDIGNSYVLTLDGDIFFHAGDLNAWIWKDESTEEEVKKALSEYNDIVDMIATKYPRMDYAMFPVDSRIGTDYFTGAKIFAEKIDVGHFFPMHSGLGESRAEIEKRMIDASRTDLYANKKRGEYICLQTPYASFSSFGPCLPEHPREEKR